MTTLNYTAILLTLSIASIGHADLRTQDNVNYLVSLKDGLNQSQQEKCVSGVCRLSGASGSGDCRIVFQVADTVILTANLTAQAADKLRRIKCIASVEEENAVSAKSIRSRLN